MKAEQIGSDVVMKNIQELENRLTALPAILLGEADYIPERGSYVARVPLDRQYTITVLMENICRVVELHHLYAFTSKDTKWVKTVAYATPFIDGLFSIHLESLQYGLVEVIHIRYYESMEVMLNILKQERLSIARLNVTISQQEDITSLLRNFVK